MKEMDMEWEQLRSYWAEVDSNWERKSPQRLQMLLKGREKSLIRTLTRRIIWEICLMTMVATGLVWGTYLMNSPYQFLERLGILGWSIITIALYGRVLWYVGQPVEDILSVKEQLKVLMERIRDFLSVHTLLSSWVLPIWVSVAMLYGLYLGLLEMNAGFPDIPIYGWGIIFGVLLLYLLFSRIVSVKYIYSLYQQPLEELEASYRELED
ncbi:MAG: hypothetical protein AAF655_00740 [Bacteroidota bacterium]